MASGGGGGWRQSLVRLMESHRGLIVVLFCLPASFVFDVAFRMLAWVRRELLAAPNKHPQRVAEIQARVSAPHGVTASPGSRGGNRGAWRRYRPG